MTPDVLNRLHSFLAGTAFPSRWQRTGGARTVVETVGLLGLVLMAFFLALGNTGQSVGMALLIIASLLAWRVLWAGLKKDWVTHFVLIWFCFVLVRMIWAAWEMPELAYEHLDSTRALARVLLLPLACWWLGGTPRSVISLCLLVLAGAVVGILYYGDWTGLDLFTTPLRLTFGGDPRMEGLLYASILAGMIAFVRSWWGPYSNRLVFFVRALLWVLLYLLILWALIAVQARAAWVAGATIGSLFVVWFVFRTLRHRVGRSAKFELAVALILLVGTSVVLASFADKISQRMLEAQETYELVLRGDLEQIEDPSLAVRIYMLDVGWNAWLDRPLVGWGPGVSHYLISHADIPPEFQNYWELHNNYLEVLVRFGLIGALSFFGFWLWLIRRFVAGWWKAETPIDMGAFVISVSLIFLMVNFTDTYIEFQFGWFYMTLLCALLHSPLMRPPTDDIGLQPMNSGQDVDRRAILSGPQRAAWRR